MTEPQGDDRAVDTRLQQFQRHRVSKQMDGDPLPLQRRTYSGGVRGMFFQQVLHAMNAQALTLCIWKQQAFIASLRLT
jgi:hypothetical protein